MACREIYLDEKGYFKFKDSNRHVHHEIAELKLGRRLRPGEVVHHIDGNRRNNSPHNLQVFRSRQEYNAAMREQAAMHHYQSQVEGQNKRLEREAQKREAQRTALRGMLLFIPRVLLTLLKELVCILTALFFFIGCYYSLEFLFLRLPGWWFMGIAKTILTGVSALLSLVIFYYSNRLARPLTFTPKSALEAIAGFFALLIPSAIIYAISEMRFLDGTRLFFTPVVFLIVPWGAVALIVARKMLKDE